MCGICGLISKAPITPDHQESVRKVNASLRFRGPDGEGEHAHPHVHLAMRRLAIIDLNGGWQPLYNEDKSIALVANGEVYNFVELREKLENLGHRFRTHSDCETILHGYEQWGDDVVHELRGMYAFALLDTRRNRVLLGRDRMGEKPLYLCEKDGQIWFASELRALMSARLVPFKLDPSSINLYYHFQYVPEPRTPIVGIRKLPAGCRLSVDLGTWQVREERYWRLDDAPPIEGDPKTIIRAELDRIADIITRADVPVGVALSAGVDSSAVAALVARRKPGQIHALCVGYPGRNHSDEREPARRWANELRMPFHEVEIPVREVVEMFPERAYWRDDPIADAAGHGYYAVSRLARTLDIPVLLQGQGGDELFWGYEWLRRAVRMSREKAAGTNTSMMNRWRRLLDHLPKGLSQTALRGWASRNLGLWHGYQHLNPDASEPADRCAFYNMTVEYQLGAWGAPRIFTRSFLGEARQMDPGSLFTFDRPWPDVGALLTRLVCETYLLENGMTQADRLSMMNSVEVRLPLSDYRLAEVAVGLRKAHPDDHLAPKYWLRQAISDLLPDWILNRPKTGFTPPSKRWMPALADAYRTSLSDGFLTGHGILDSAKVDLLLQSYSRLSPWPDLFFRSLILEFWCRGIEHAVGESRSRLYRIPNLA